MNSAQMVRALWAGVGSLAGILLSAAPLRADPPAAHVEIAPASISAPADAPVIPWVTADDTKWHDGPSLFDISDIRDPSTKARGWMAVTDQQILLRVIVTHPAHLSSGGGDALWSGDGIQFGIDPLGLGADQPALADVEGELKKQFGAAAADPHNRDVQNARGNLKKQNSQITNGDMLAMRPEDEDFCVGTGPGDAAQVYTYYSGHRGAGPTPSVLAKVTRDNDAQTTTYDVAIPWSEFGAPAGLSPIVKVSFQINNTIGALGKQRRIYWGGGVGGRFAPWKFQTLAIAPPPAGTKMCSILCVKHFVTADDDDVEALAAVCNTPATLSARLGAAAKSLDLPASPAIARYTVRGYPGVLHGSVEFTADLTNGDTKADSTVASRVFNDSSANWYTFAPKSDVGPSVVGMQDWMDAPAGKHGFAQVKGKDIVFEDGTPVKFWGVGTASYANGLAPDHKTADAFAAWYAKWGVNSVRNGLLFGTSWMGMGDPNDTTRMIPGLLERFDYSFSALKNKGIYYNVIAFWNEGLRPADRDKVLNYNEAKNHAGELDNFDTGIQDLHIAAIVNFLNHKNPYTGLTYADDPALSCIEIRNEQDIYWYTVAGAVAASPTYRAAICKQFCDWLRTKYGTQDKLVAVWGKGCIGTMIGCAKDESLDGNTLTPVFNAWFFSKEGMALIQKQCGGDRRLLDCAEYLYETQTKYYTRVTDAIRAAGYKGMVLGSNWQAGDGLGNLYNLLSDRSVGRIDRHNYFGGAGMPGMSVGIPEDDSSMLWQPGRALLSSGLQQMADRPFGLSEWMDQAPNEWAAEAPPIIGFYGFGLQGWDVAYDGNNTEPQFDPNYGTWLHVQTPMDLSLYPAIARSVFRGDIKEGPTIAARRFTPDDLRNGTLDFTDTVAQAGDVKTIRSSVPQESLAAGRVVLELVDKPTPSLIPDLTAALRQKTIVSNTGQLEWHYPSHDESYFTVNSDGTKGVVGFAPNKPFALGDVTVQVDNKFAVLLVTALDRGKTLADTPSALVTAIARARNTGMVYTDTGSLLAVGKAPVVMEPVVGSVTFGRKLAKVYLLDHDGKRTDRTAGIDAGKLTVDGNNDKTMYYEVVFE